MSLVLLGWVFPGLMIFAAISDVMARKIANWIPLTMLAGFGVLAFATGMAWSDVGLALLMGVAAFFAGFALFAMGQMGGGDVKLIAASLPWYGASMLAIDYLIAFSLFGAVVTIVFIIRRWAPVQMMLVSNRYSAPLAVTPTQTREVPYGLAIALGALAVHPFLLEHHGLI